MSEHLTSEDIQRLLGCAAETAPALLEHLSACAECSARLKSVANIAAHLHDAPPPELPKGCPWQDRVVAYANVLLPDAQRPAVEAHLLACEECCALLAFLQPPEKEQTLMQALQLAYGVALVQLALLPVRGAPVRSASSAQAFVAEGANAPNIRLSRHERGATLDIAPPGTSVDLYDREGLPLALYASGTTHVEVADEAVALVLGGRHVLLLL